MARTLAELESLLKDKGFPCRRIFDLCVMTELPTKAYTNAKGDRSIEIHLAFDKTHGCLTLDTPWAFDSKKASHKEAMLACLLSASAKSPLVKTQLDPTDGEVRLRVDCCCGSDGVEPENVLRLLSLIPEFADRWYPHIKTAMEKGTFDPAGGRPAADESRLKSIARRAGGIEALEKLIGGGESTP